jgi:hypothetical protein
MSEPPVIVRKGANGVVKTAVGDRPPTPVPDMEELLKPSAVVAKGSPPPRVNEPPNAPSAFTRRGGRQRRRKTRRHRGGGKMTVVQDGAVWRIKENAPDGTTATSEQSWSSAEDAMQIASTIKTIKDLTPDQEERRAIAKTGKALSNMKTGGKKSRRRRRHH